MKQKVFSCCMETGTVDLLSCVTSRIPDSAGLGSQQLQSGYDDRATHTRRRHQQAADFHTADA